MNSRTFKPEHRHRRLPGRATGSVAVFESKLMTEVLIVRAHGQPLILLYVH